MKLLNLLILIFFSIITIIVFNHYSCGCLSEQFYTLPSPQLNGLYYGYGPVLMNCPINEIPNLYYTIYYPEKGKNLVFDTQSLDDVAKISNGVISQNGSSLKLPNNFTNTPNYTPLYQLGTGNTPWNDTTYPLFTTNQSSGNTSIIQQIIDNSWGGVCFDWENIGTGDSQNIANFKTLLSDIKTNYKLKNGSSLKIVVVTNYLGPYKSLSSWTSEDAEGLWDNVDFVSCLTYGGDSMNFPSQPTYDRMVNFWKTGGDPNQLSPSPQNDYKTIQETPISIYLPPVESSKFLWSISYLNTTCPGASSGSDCPNVSTAQSNPICATNWYQTIVNGQYGVGTLAFSYNPNQG